MENFVYFISIVFGSGGAITAIGEMPDYITAILVSIIPLISTLGLVYGFREKGRLHHDLSNEFIRLEKDLVKAEKPASKNAEWKARILEIETREPPRKKVLNILMHNELCIVRDQKEHLYKVGWIRRLFAHLVDINPDEIVLDRRYSCKHKETSNCKFGPRGELTGDVV